MAKAENDVLNKVRLAASKEKFVTFRNNTGNFRTLDGKRIVQAGLGKDTHDLIGWRSVIVTPEMVGKRIAVFTSIEIKTDEGKMSDGQINFLKVVRESGGISFVARSENHVPKKELFNFIGV